MIYLFVGDAETQCDKLKDLGFGEAVLLNDKTATIEQVKLDLFLKRCVYSLYL